jgi:SAM-dependent methyltransferase
VDGGGAVNTGSAAETSSLIVLRNIPRLAEHLAEYDLLITHFGLSAFEALRAGTPVLLVSPGRRHERLARAAGFLSAGTGKRGVRRLAPFLRGAAWAGLVRRRESLARRHGVAGRDGPGLADLLAGFEPACHRCPGCGTGQEAGPFHPVLARFPDRSFRRCTSCGLIYMSRINEAPIEYGREYFFEFYQRQYGKTYLEDFPQLMDMGNRRLDRIIPLIPRASPQSGGGKARALLDIGCAYGPFLKAAAGRGFDVCGLDPAEDAVRYVWETLAFRALRGFFPGPERFPAASFSVITMWYVIEHIGALAEALAEAGRLLEEGGVLAFSTPSFSGISGRAGLRGFLERSPADHRTIWNPRVSRGLLRRYGFTQKKAVSTGHHPERFPLLGRYCGGAKGPVYRVLLLLSRIFGLGDTFEVYAVKETR